MCILVHETKLEFRFSKGTGRSMEKNHHYVLQFVNGIKNLWRQVSVGCSEKFFILRNLLQHVSANSFRLGLSFG